MASPAAGPPTVFAQRIKLLVSVTRAIFVAFQLDEVPTSLVRHVPQLKPPGKTEESFKSVPAITSMALR